MTAIDFTAFVDKLAGAASDAILPFFRTSLSVENKSRGGNFDPVTAADRVLDPIDGTKSFISGMPAWGTLIALMRYGEPVYGMMHQPFTREHFSGDVGAAHYRGPAGPRALHARRCASLGRTPAAM